MDLIQCSKSVCPDTPSTNRKTKKAKSNWRDNTRRALAVQAWRSAFKKFSIGKAGKRGLGLFARHRLKPGRVELWGFPVPQRKNQETGESVVVHKAIYEGKEGWKRVIAGPMGMLNAACEVGIYSLERRQNNSLEPVWKSAKVVREAPRGQEIYACDGSVDGSWHCSSKGCKALI